MLLIYCVLIFVSFTDAQQLASSPKLEFIRDNNATVYTINFKEEFDTTHDPMYLPAVQTASKICSIGIWRFYPETNYARDPNDPNNDGVQLGHSELEECIEGPEIVDIKVSLAAMKSYRYLGQPDLNQFSLSVYDGDNAFGTEWSRPLGEFEFYNLPTNFVVRSYLLTGITDPSVEYQYRNAPTVKVFWERDGGPGTSICLALINPSLNATSQPKMYYRKSMAPQGEEPGEPVAFGSFMMLRYTTASTPGFCDLDPDQNMLGMIHLHN